MENIYGKMVEFMRDNGVTTRWRAKASSYGWTAASTKDSIKTIKRKASASLLSKTGGYTKDNGRTESSMEKEFSRNRV